MRVAVFDHQGKSAHLARALQAAGHELVQEYPWDVLLVDCDHAEPRRTLIGVSHQTGARILQYQHGALPSVQYDGIIQPDGRVHGLLVHGHGIADVYRLCGHPGPFHTVGWAYSPLADFQPPPTVSRVLFAPLHPFGDGTISQEERRWNRTVADRLERLDVQVTVQAYLTPEHNGFELRPGWRYVPSTLALDWTEIDRHDAVIGFGTIAYLAVARGKPTVMVAQDRPIRGDDLTTEVKNWGRYQHLLRYPLDITDGPLDLLLEQARRGTPEVDEWKHRMLGGPLNLPAVEQALRPARLAA